MTAQRYTLMALWQLWLSGYLAGFGLAALLTGHWIGGVLLTLSPLIGALSAQNRRLAKLRPASKGGES